MSSTYYPYVDNRGDWIDTTKNGVNYDFLKDCYYSSGGFANGKYLIPYPVENSYKFKIRKNKREITNHFKSIIDAQVDPIFRVPALRTFETEDQISEIFLNNVDYKGTHLDRFMKKVALSVKVNGSAYVMVDNVIEPPRTKLEEIRDRKIPYLSLIEPSQIKSYNIDENGVLVEFSYYANISQNGTILSGSKISGDNSNVNYTWTPDLITINNSDGKIELENTLGYIPIVRVTDNETDDFIPFPSSYGLATTQLRIFNLNSDISEVEDNQGHSLFYIQSHDLTSLSNSPNNVIRVDMDAKMPPNYASPNASNLATLVKNREVRVADMYSSVGLPMPSAYAISGEAKKMDLVRFHEKVHSLKESLEYAEVEIWMIFFDYWDDYSNIPTIKYNDKFGLDGLIEDIEELERLDTLDIPIPLKSMILKNIMIKKLGIDQSDQEKIDEIDNIFDVWENLKKIDIA